MTATAMGVAVAAAKDAVARIDDGVARPGDAALAGAYDSYCDQAWLVLDDQRREAENAQWLCDDCSDEPEVAA